MSMKIEDWQVTAFALGELSGEEAQAIAVAVAADPALRQQVEDARRRAGVLAERLTADAGEPVEVAPVPEPGPRPARIHRSTWWFVAATAAACAVLAITWPEFGPSPRSTASTEDGSAFARVAPPSATTGYDPARMSREWKGDFTGPRVSLQYGEGEIEEPAIFFPEAREADHNESADGHAFGDLEVTGALSLGPSAAAPYAASPPPPGRPAMKPHALVTNRNPAPAGGGPIGPILPQPGADIAHNTEDYPSIAENAFLSAKEDPLSTFSIDVDTASYANVRRFLTGGMLPPPDAVRIEELINYFSYDYAQPDDEHPFAVHLEMAACPWESEHRLLRVGLKGREIDLAKRPPSNLVFLIDVSGSMNQPNKLPLVKSALSLMVDQLTENDRVSMVVYAGASGLVLPPTTGDHGAAIRNAIENLSAGGSTNGGAGIELAYSIAVQNFVQGGTNRVILATDGDWNVGVTNQGDLVRLIEEKAKSGVFLSVLGFGMGNYKDGTLEQLADKGNGNYGYIDTLSEARKVLVEQMAGTLCTIAKDVKIQIEFNPARVAGYRLIGYENRLLAKEDFNDDKKDAGEIGAGHTVTALYEVVPAGQPGPDGRPPVDPLKYQDSNTLTPAAENGELCTVKLRYKAPQSDTSTLMEVPLKDEHERFDEASADFRFAASVAGYGMLLRRSEHAKGFTWDALSEIASGGLGADKGGYRAEFIELVKRAKTLSR